MHEHRDEDDGPAGDRSARRDRAAKHEHPERVEERFEEREECNFEGRKRLDGATVEDVRKRVLDHSEEDENAKAPERGRCGEVAARKNAHEDDDVCQGQNQGWRPFAQRTSASLQAPKHDRKEPVTERGTKGEELAMEPSGVEAVGEKTPHAHHGRRDGDLVATLGPLAEEWPGKKHEEYR